MDKKFPIGFWNYAPTGAYGPEAVKDWVDCGMTLTMSPEFNPSIHKKEDLLAILDECEKQGIKLIICDSRARWDNADSNPLTYRERYLKAYEDFGRHPATFGFHIGDEPSGKAFDDCIAAYNIQLELAPELTPFINFLPYWDGMQKDVLLSNSFEEWAADFTKKSNLKFFCYDHYGQMNPEESGTDNYFKNLNKFSNAALSAGIPYWTTLLSVGHFRYRCPKEDDIRWQLYTALASGCTGILWFFFYMRKPMANYRASPIDEHNERTETYEWLSRVLRTFTKQYGELFTRIKLKKAYHAVKAYGGYELFYEDAHPFIKALKSHHNLPCIISFFNDEMGHEYFALTNNNPKDSGLFTVNIDKKIKSIMRIIWEGEEVDVAKNHGDAVYNENGTENYVTMGTWLAPGQMEIYRIE